VSLQLNGVGKQYRRAPWYLRPFVRVASTTTVDALHDVTFDVQPGEIVGLVGPNGAGKTTLLKIISTLLEPSAGSVRIDDIDVLADPRAARERLGIVLNGERATYWRIDGRQNLEFFGVLAGLPLPEAREKATELLERLGLADRDRRVMGYSSGMRAALNVGRAVMAEPSLIVLDEPTRSLDPLASVTVGRLLREQADAGRSVLLSSHRMDEVATWCDRVVLLIDGTVRHIGPMDDGDFQRSARDLLDLLEREVNGS
jgi:ABC-type multidrug transport system ATPase subunit